MPYNGNGAYQAPQNSWNPPVQGAQISVSDWIALLNDLASALSQVLVRDGQSAMTGALNMGGQAINAASTVTATGNISAANPTDAGHVVTKGWGETAFALANRVVSTGTGLTGGGDLSANRSLSIAATGVTAGNYGASGSGIPHLTLNAQGQVTAATNRALASGEVTSALGYTPYNGATNPNGYLASISGTMVTNALGFSDLARLGVTQTFAGACTFSGGTAINTAFGTETALSFKQAGILRSYIGIDINRNAFWAYSDDSGAYVASWMQMTRVLANGDGTSHMRFFNWRGETVYEGFGRNGHRFTGPMRLSDGQWTADGAGLVFEHSPNGNVAWRTLYDRATGHLNTYRYNSTTGALIDSPLVLRTDGVVSIGEAQGYGNSATAFWVNLPGKMRMQGGKVSVSPGAAGSYSATLDLPKTLSLAALGPTISVSVQGANITVGSVGYGGLLAGNQISIAYTTSAATTATFHVTVMEQLA